MKRNFTVILVALLSALSCVHPVAFPQTSSSNPATSTQPAQPTSSSSKTPYIVDFIASPANVKAGTEITLKWEVTNADTVNINQGVGTVPFSGSVKVTPTASVAYTLSATNSKGSSTSTLNVTVSGSVPQSTPASFNLPEVVVFTAVPANIAAEQTVTLAWDVRNAYDVTIEPGFRIIRAKGTAQVMPTIPTTYKLKATNDQGTILATTTVTVSDVPPNEETPVIQFLTVDRYVIKKGEKATLSWKTTEASSVSIDKGVGTVPGTGSAGVSPSETTTYTMICTNSRGAQFQTVTVNVR